jgi:hypothetical protein
LQRSDHYRFSPIPEDVKERSLQFQSATATLSLLVCIGLDLAIPHPLGFLDLAAIPYIALVMMHMVISGIAGALITAGGAWLWIALVGPWVAPAVGSPAEVVTLATVPAGARYAAVVIILAAIVVMNRDRKLQAGFRQTSIRARECRAELERVQQEARMLEMSLRVGSNRMATERSSITMLYEQVQRLQSFEQEEVLDATLASVRLMTGATSCAVYAFREETLQLHRAGFWPQRHQERYKAVLSVSSSVEGQVVRTGRLFSLRQLVDDPRLRDLDTRNVVICAPILVRNRIWGVITVGRMPFMRYNEYAEKVLQVTAALVAPALEQALPGALAGQASLEAEDSREGTAEPPPTAPSQLLPYAELPEALATRVEQSREMGYHVAFLLVELRAALDNDGIAELSETVGSAVAVAAGRGATVYQYQQLGQIAIISAGTGSDATGYLLLRIMELVASRAWTVGDETVLPEAVVGFGTSTQCGYDPWEMVRRAEQMVAVQLPENGHG